MPEARRQLLRVADDDHVRVRESSDHPQRGDRRHRRLVKDDGVKASRLDRLALVRARQRRRHHHRLADDEGLDLGERILDLLQFGTDCTERFD
jgi:hypothetical protein